MRQPSDLEQRFWRIFRRTLGLTTASGSVARHDTENWDSLKHVELVFELEEAFGIDIGPDDIVALYSSTDVILEYLGRRVEGVERA